MFLITSVRKEVRMREMARPRTVTWCLWRDAWVARLVRTRMRRGRKRA
jgi:hypothetical protein